MYSLVPNRVPQHTQVAVSFSKSTVDMPPLRCTVSQGVVKETPYDNVCTPADTCGGRHRNVSSRLCTVHGVSLTNLSGNLITKEMLVLTEYH